MNSHIEGQIVNIANGKKENVEWNGDFNKSSGYVNIKSTHPDGTTNYELIPFNKNNFNDLFTQHISGASLEERLMTDFGLNDGKMMNENKNKKKTKYHHKKNKKHKSRKYKK